MYVYIKLIILIILIKSNMLIITTKWGGRLDIPAKQSIEISTALGQAPPDIHNFVKQCLTYKLSYFIPFHLTVALTGFRPTENSPDPNRPIGLVGSLNSISTQNKSPDNKSYRVIYGATYGLGLEPYCIKFAQYCLHETELIEQVHKYFL